MSQTEVQGNIVIKTKPITTYLLLLSRIEPVEVTNKYDATQLKNAVDDEIARVRE
jgi:hypothetical protein